MFTNQKLSNKYQIIKPTQFAKNDQNKQNEIKTEEINTNVEPEKMTIENNLNIETPKSTNINLNESDEKNEIKKEDKNTDDDDFIHDIKLNEEREITKIEIEKNIFVRIIQTEKGKFVDFCKFYKGYPTKKNIRIKYDLYVKLNKILI